MCQPDKEIHLCSCASIAPIPYPGSLEDGKVNQEDYTKTHFIWKLNRYLGKKDSGMMGEMRMPLQRLSEEITTDKLIIELTRKDIFDFEYIPKEGDELIIREEYIYKTIKGKSRPELYDFISLIFRDGSWKDDFYNVFSERTRMFKKGVINFESPTQKTI